MSSDEFEVQLRQALRREEPPAGFASRTMKRLPRQRRWLPLALAAGLALGAAVPAALYEQRQQKGREAERQLVTALEITRAKLRQTREKIQRRANRI